MRYLTINLLLAVVLAGCSATGHLKRAQVHLDKAREKDPSLFHTLKDSVARPVIIPGVTATFNFTIPKDTFSVTQISQDGVRIDYKYLRDTLVVEVECPPDTVVVYDTKTVEIATPKITYKAAVKQWFGLSNFWFWVIHIGVVLIVLLVLAVKVFKLFTIPFLILLLSMNEKPTNPKDAVAIGKVPMSCISGPVLMEVGLGMMEGALKYGRHNYRAVGVRASVYFDALQRHMWAWWEGEDIDPDSGINHISKTIADLTVLRDSMIRSNWTDDRPPKTNPEWIRDLNKAATALLEKYPDRKEAIIEKGSS